MFRFLPKQKIYSRPCFKSDSLNLPLLNLKKSAFLADFFVFSLLLDHPQDRWLRNLAYKNFTIKLLNI